jgi:cytoskeletal protein RodZ
MDPVATMGQRLKQAREQRGESLSEAALKTRIKIQHLEAIERDDFSKMPAATYAKGFLRMYAEHLGIDPSPLLKEYGETHAGQARPPALAEPEAPRPAKDPLEALRLAASRLKPALSKAGLARLVAGLAASAVIVACLVAQKSCREDRAAGEPARSRATHAVVREPPEPYLPIPAKP